MTAATVIAWCPAAAQDGFPIDPEAAPRPATEARVATGPIRIDARLDDRAWAAAVPITDFVQSQPDRGFPPTERTAVRILYDDDNLYVGAICYDSEPDKLVITSLEHDFGAGAGGSTREMDIFSITLDTFLDRRNSFIFLVNPGGAFRDGQTFNDSRQIDFAWRGVVQVKTAIHDSGYTVEMAIPWTTLRFNPADAPQDWGFNMLRRVRRKSEDSYWAPLDRRDPVHRMSKAGTLTGLEGLRAGRNLQVKPYARSSDVSGSAVAAGESGFEWNAGGDMKWGVTAGLTFDGTVRTDFSEVDVDQEQVNLTRFPLFFPERREFFVENSGSFILGDVSERNYRTGASLRDFTLFHSRRIGRSSAGRPIPILGGGRLTGRAGPFEVGLLDIQTEDADGLPGENFGVVRVRRNFGGSDAGVMFINRQATGSLADGEFSRSYAADANLRPAPGLVVNSYLAYTDGHDAAGDRVAGRVAVGWRDRLWDLSAFVKHVGDGFDPGVGFVRRRGVREGYVTVGAHPQPALRWLQELNPYGEARYVTDLDGTVLTRIGTAGFAMEFRDGARAEVEYENRMERLLEPDEVSGVTLPEGEYLTHQGAVTYTSSRAKRFSGNVRLSHGGFFDGSRLGVSLQGQFRVHYRLTLDANVAHNDVELGGERFTADLFGFRARFSYSTALFVQAFVQYNGQSDRLATQARLNWIYGPLSDVFLVFNETRDLQADVVAERSIAVKVTRLLAF